MNLVMKNNHIKTILLSLLLINSNNILSSTSVENTYNKLIKEIRCMVCQNQNIAESEAPLAVDLRKKIKTMLNEGKSELFIKNYLSERYSDFILYDPPMKIRNIILWFGPFIFLLFLGLYFFRNKT